MNPSVQLISCSTCARARALIYLGRTYAIVGMIVVCSLSPNLNRALCSSISSTILNMIGNHSTSFDRWNQLSLVTGSPQEKHHALVRSVFFNY
jgi:hypothetical protein